MFNIDKVNKVYIAVEFTDMRKSIDGLSIIVMQEFKLDIYETALFVFCNKNKNKIKILHWDNGFWLYYYRLDKGRLKWPNVDSETIDITVDEFKWLLKGYEPRISNKLRVKKSLINY